VVTNAVIERVGIDIGADNTAAEPELLSLLFSLVAYCRPAVIVEAGTYRGHATLAMAAALRQHHIRGRIWTADVADYGQREAIIRNDVGHLVTCHFGDFEAVLEHSGPPDFAFIDSGPVVNATTGVLDNREVGVRYRHFLAAQRLMPKGSLIVVDDTASDWVGRAAIAQAGLTLLAGRGVTLVCC
jgi:hypothetical protein